MPWCPKCRSEYRTGFTHCADCDAELVDVLPPETETENETNDSPEFIEFEKEVVLETFDNNIEYMYVASMLDELNIPYHVRSKGGATLKDIYTLNVRIEKTICVDDKDFSRAEEVLASLDAYLMEDYEEDDDEYGYTDQEDYDDD